MEGGRGWQRAGKCYVYQTNPSQKPILVIGPDCDSHIGCFFLALFVVLGSVGGVFSFHLAAKVSYGFQVIGVVIFSVMQGSYLMAAFLDPGMGERDRDEEESLSSPLLSPYCHSCRAHQSPKAVHCTICGICVVNRDHHCPWIGKCIGEENATYFFCFVSALLAMIGFMLVCAALLSNA